jgi:hypothetical protein
MSVSKYTEKKNEIYECVATSLCCPLSPRYTGIRKNRPGTKNVRYRSISAIHTAYWRRHITCREAKKYSPAWNLIRMSIGSGGDDGPEIRQRMTFDHGMIAAPDQGKMPS